jgi:acetyltransferase-like isoleucine patch superfamily enzyme
LISDRNPNQESRIKNQESRIEEPADGSGARCVRLGRGVTVGVGSMIGIGVEAGDGYQIGALSVVPKYTKLEARAIYAGVPVRKPEKAVPSPVEI